MNLKKVVRGAISIAASAALTLGMVGTPAQANNTLTIAQLIDVRSWEPTQADIGHSIPFYQAVYDNLILRAPNGTYKPNLATRWTVAKDAKSITLTLRTGVKFTDGTAFNATVAKKNLDAFIAANGPQTATMAGATVRVLTPNSIRITLKEANPDIVYYLATSNSFMASERAIGTEALKTKPVGSGPYVLDASSVPGSQLVFTKNNGYWDKSKQKFDRIVMRIIPDVNARMNALISGQIDAGLLDVKTGETAKARGLTERSYYTDWQGIMLLDRDGKVNPAMKDVRVRQAINHAFDRPAMLKSLMGGKGEVTNQIFGKASGAYVANLDNYYKYDPAKAKSLLRSAGYPNGLKISMPAIPDPTTKAVTEQYLKDIGITVEWANVPPIEYRNALLSAKYEAGWFGLFQGTAWVNFNLAIAPNGARNVFKNSTGLVNNAYKNVLSNPSPENVKMQMTTINREIVKQAWFAPFYRVPQLFYTSKRVTVQPQAQNAVPYIYNYSPSGK
jgi:peptide/nickel transport system substrate-binding protein